MNSLRYMDAHMVTVVMPVHNGSAYLRDAIDSVLAQSYSNFEFLIVDDCSSDDTASIIRSYVDSRIRLIEAKERLKICKALNTGIEQAKGKYIARMDADDICRPMRLGKQVAYMERNPNVGVCGTWVKRFGPDIPDYIDKRPCSPDDVRAFALFDNPVVHSSVMLRRDLLTKSGVGYLDEYRNAEDYELWTRLLPVSQIVNIPEVLLDYRVHSQSVTVGAGKDMDEAAFRVVARLLRNLGLNPTNEEILFHRYLGTGRLYPERNREALVRAAEWLKRIVTMNRAASIYPERALVRAIAQVWYRACYHSLSDGMWTIRSFLSFYLGMCKGAYPQSVPMFLGAATKCMCRHMIGAGCSYCK